MQSSKLEALIESLNLTDEKSHEIRKVLKDMLAHAKETKKGISEKDAKLLLMAKLVEENDWKKRAGIAASIISLNL